MEYQHNWDSIVVGGGLVGLAIAYGLGRLGRSCLVLDAGDLDFRAARGNFGLVWVQGKGSGFPPYADWSMTSSQSWPDLAAMLHEQTGAPLALEQKGGLDVCLTEDELNTRISELTTLSQHQNGRFQFKVLDREALAELQPGIGDVAGATWSPHDGHVSPLYLMRGLHDAIHHQHGYVKTSCPVTAITQTGTDIQVTTPDGNFTAPRLVLAAGLGNRVLAPFLSLEQAVKPQRGQIMVTEKLPVQIRYPMVTLRQTAEGTIMIGDSHEDAGLDVSSTRPVMAEIASRAQRILPSLSQAQIIRSWAALRVMSPDGYPIYDQSPSIAGAFAVTCHSGVTLAAAHALDLARCIHDGHLSPHLTAFSERRFDVSAA